MYVKADIYGHPTLVLLLPFSILTFLQRKTMLGGAVVLAVVAAVPAEGDSSKVSPRPRS